MKWIYKNIGVKYERLCSECNAHMNFYKESFLEYIVCQNDNCRNLVLLESNNEKSSNDSSDEEAEYMRDWITIGMFHIESISREHEAGFVSKNIWKKVMELEFKVIYKPDNFEDILEFIWNANITKYLVRKVQLEKVKSIKN